MSHHSNPTNDIGAKAEGKITPKTAVYATNLQSIMKPAQRTPFTKIVSKGQQLRQPDCDLFDWSGIQCRVQDVYSIGATNEHFKRTSSHHQFSEHSELVTLESFE